MDTKNSVMNAPMRYIAAVEKVDIVTTHNKQWAASLF